MAQNSAYFNKGQSSQEDKSSDKISMGFIITNHLLNLGRIACTSEAEVFSNGVNFMHQLLAPYWDQTYMENYAKLMGVHNKIISDVGAPDANLIASMDFKLSQAMFQQLMLLASRKGLVPEQTTIEVV